MKKGFTLIELMVVVAIMAILAIAGLSIFTTAREKAKDSRLKHDVKAWKNVVEQQYDIITETYPGTVTVDDFEGDVVPSAVEITYDPRQDLEIYCIYSDVLNDNTAGNCAGTGGDGVCDWNGTTSFCVESSQ